MLPHRVGDDDGMTTSRRWWTCSAADRAEQVRHVREIPERAPVHAPWPDWLHPDVVDAYERLGIRRPYAHQVAALAAPPARDRGHRHRLRQVARLPGYVVDAVHRGRLAVAERPGCSTTRTRPPPSTSPHQGARAAASACPCALWVSTTSQGRHVRRRPDLGSAAAIRGARDVILCNPDMLRHGVLPDHAGWSGSCGSAT
ncbi:hypothetical protein QJS66_18760 [Kocuria rhizophila]|nr:hypothetical protein QJS66_18760 [Kocuria rhizophila]